ncbi:hypothetical protein B8W90_12210, partial [Staphylococcus hominis]
MRPLDPLAHPFFDVEATRLFVVAFGREHVFHAVDQFHQPHDRLPGGAGEQGLVPHLLGKGGFGNAHEGLEFGTAVEYLIDQALHHLVGH